MQQSPIVARRERISRVEKRPVKEYFINVSPGDSGTESQHYGNHDLVFHNLFALYRRSPKRQIRWRQLFFLDRFRRTIRAIPLVNFGSKMGMVLNLFAQ